MCRKAACKGSIFHCVALNLMSQVGWLGQDGGVLSSSHAMSTGLTGWRQHMGVKGLGSRHASKRQASSAMGQAWCQCTTLLLHLLPPCWSALQRTVQLRSRACCTAAAWVFVSFPGSTQSLRIGLQTTASTASVM